jgi:sensor histidine kinase regulating citrate/malate metabolism
MIENITNLAKNKQETIIENIGKLTENSLTNVRENARARTVEANMENTSKTLVLW